MNRRRYKTTIPETAREVIDKSYPDGSKEETSYFVGRNRVGRRVWWDDGATVCLECGLNNSKKHGNELDFYPDGQLRSVEPFRNGIMHGKTRQFSHDGVILIEYVLRNGVGLDLWCYEGGALSEERYWAAEGELAYRRDWNEDNKSIHLEELWFADDEWHGIFRKWNDKGRLRRGFPQFYINSTQTTKRQYLRACESDHSMIRHVPEHDQPYRTLPDDYLAQRKRATKRI